MQTLIPSILLLLLLFPLSSHSQPDPRRRRLPDDGLSLLAFKAKADLTGKLHYTIQTRFNYCQWQGVKCRQGRVVRFAIDSYGLRGTFAGDTLTGLNHLRVLILRNNSLSGTLPDLSPLSNLRSIILDHNSFSGTFPASIFSLHQLRALDLSFNNFSGGIPPGILRLDRLHYLQLQFNRFNGSLPPMNQSDLGIFNITGNHFSGRIPVTATLSRFPLSSFSLNPNLCGEIISKPCVSDYSPLLDASSSILSPPVPHRRHKRGLVVLGLSLGALFLTSALLCVFLTTRKQRRRENPGEAAVSETTETEVVRVKVRLDSQSKELKEKCKELEVGMRREMSGNLVFLMGETKLYTLDQLMKGSAEYLGKGTVGTTYKAKLDDQMIVTVKRVDPIRMSGVSGEVFERYMEVVGALRHPNLVPVRAYFQAKEERLIIYDYQPNGSIFNLIHGSRPKRAKPLHWTSCLKIAEDVAQGLNYLHRAPNLVHGNLKSSNVLLGQDFEARLADYCLAPLAASPSNCEDPHSVCEDVYAYGLLLLELLSGTPQAQHPFLEPHDMSHWVKAMRVEDDNDDDDYDTFEDTQLRMLVEVACLCSLTSPQQRPTIRQVLKIIQKIKATVNPDVQSIGFS